MRKNKISMVLILGFTTISFLSAEKMNFQAVGNFKCGSYPEKVFNQDLRFCFLSKKDFNSTLPLLSTLRGKTFSAKNYRSLFYFHGLGQGNLEAPMSFLEKLLKERLQETPSGEKNILTFPILFSFGPAWLLSRNPKNYETKILIEKIMPEIQSIVAKEENVVFEKLISLMGGSMGGHNVLQIYLQAPEKVYATIAACAAVLTMPPDPTSAEIKDYILETLASPEIANSLPNLMSPSYENRESFNRDSLLSLSVETFKQSPRSLDAAKEEAKVDPVLWPKLWLVVDALDPFGFTKTNLLFAQVAARNIEKFYFSMGPGQHCTFLYNEKGTFLKFLE